MSKLSSRMRSRFSFIFIGFSISAIIFVTLFTILNPFKEQVSAGSLTKTTAPIPSGLKSTFMLGLSNGSGELGWMTGSGANWDARAQFLVGDVTNPGGNWAGWDSPAGAYLTKYLRDCAAHNYLPVLNYYTMYYSSPGKYQANEGNRSLVNLKTPATMKAYFTNFKLMLDISARYGQAVVIQVEPDFWGFISRASGGNTLANVPAMVASSGYGDVTAGLPDNAAGFAQALFALRNKYAPNVKLAYHNSVWGSGTDINSTTDPNVNIANLVGISARIYKSIGVQFDLLTMDVSDRDSGYYARTDSGNTRHWWDMNNVIFPNFERYRQYLLGLTSQTGLRAMLIGVPLGNRFYRTENNTSHHYQDNRVEYFLGQDYKAHLQSYIDAGLIGIVFGPGQGDQTTYTDNAGDGITNPGPINGNSLMSTVSDDDGGYLRDRARNYYLNGALPLGSGVTAPPPTAQPTATTAPQPTATPKPQPTATPAPQPTATPKPQPTSGPATPTVAPSNGIYQVKFDVGQWNTGANIGVTIINKSGSPVKNWTISWDITNGETFAGVWNANCSLSGTKVTCTNLSYNGTIAANGGQAGFGATLSTPHGATTRPKVFVVNGVTVNS